MDIRFARLDDIGPVIDLWQDTGLLVPWNDPQADFRRALETATSTVFVGELDNQIMASVMAGYDGHRGWIYYVAVHSDHQGQGFGRQMIGAAEAWFRARDVPKVQLLIRRTNSAIKAFYLTLGFAESDVLVMQKWLTP